MCEGLRRFTLRFIATWGLTEWHKSRLPTWVVAAEKMAHFIDIRCNNRFIPKIMHVLENVPQKHPNSLIICKLKTSSFWVFFKKQNPTLFAVVIIFYHRTESTDCLKRPNPEDMVFPGPGLWMTMSRMHWPATRWLVYLPRQNLRYSPHLLDGRTTFCGSEMVVFIPWFSIHS